MTQKYNGIPVEIEKPNMIRLQMAVQMYKSGKHISFIKSKLNQLISEQNQLEKELGRELTPMLSEDQIKQALEWAERKEIR